MSAKTAVNTFIIGFVQFAEANPREFLMAAGIVATIFTILVFLVLIRGEKEPKKTNTSPSNSTTTKAAKTTTKATSTPKKSASATPKKTAVTTTSKPEPTPSRQSARLQEKSTVKKSKKSN